MKKSNVGIALTVAAHAMFEADEAGAVTAHVKEQNRKTQFRTLPQ